MSSPHKTNHLLLLDRTFGPFFFGKVLSVIGIWVQNLAAAVLMYDLTGSAFMVGAVSMVQFFGPLALALWVGALTDRFNRRRLLMLGRTISGAAVVTFAVTVGIGGATGFGGPPVLLVVVGVMGLGLAISTPAMAALVPALVPPTDLEQGMALNSVAPNIGRAVGPALGAFLLVKGGPALAFGFAGFTHLAFVGSLLLIRDRPFDPPSERPSPLGGFRFLRENRKVGLMMLGVAAVGIAADPVVTLTPSLARDLGGGTELVGMLATSFGLGAVLLVLVFKPLRDHISLASVGVYGFFGMAAGLLTVGIFRFAPAAAVGFFVAGFGFLMANVALTTQIQIHVPEQLRGRVMALWGVAFLGSRPVAAVVNGGIADALSVRIAFIVAAAAVGVASVLAVERE